LYQEAAMKLLFFSAPGCGPCTLFFPIVEKISADLNLELEKIDVSENLDLAVKYGIGSIPQLLVLENDNVNGRLVGLCNENDVFKLLQESTTKM